MINNTREKSYKLAKTLSNVGTYILLAVLSIIWLYPILWIVLQAFRTEYNDEGQLIGIVVSNYFPHQVGLKNFAVLFTKTQFPRWFLNTLIVSICTCIISTILTLSSAYVLSKIKFKGRKAFMNMAMILGLFPGFMSMIAIYYILKAVGLTQSLFALILCYSAGAGLGFYVAKGFFDIIPNSLVESAKLDGCNQAQIFVKIILPLSKPIIVYTALLAFTGPWMDFIFAKVIIGEGNSQCWTVSVGLYSMLFGGQADANLFSQFAAGCVCVAIPIVVLFMFLQKYYVEGVTGGAVKG